MPLAAKELLERSCILFPKNLPEALSVLLH
jgi:hypothetical protein